MFVKLLFCFPHVFKKGESELAWMLTIWASPTKQYSQDKCKKLEFSSISIFSGWLQISQAFVNRQTGLCEFMERGTRQNMDLKRILETWRWHSTLYVLWVLKLRWGAWVNSGMRGRIISELASKAGGCDYGSRVWIPQWAERFFTFVYSNLNTLMSHSFSRNIKRSGTLLQNYMKILMWVIQ